MTCLFLFDCFACNFVNIYLFIYNALEVSGDSSVVDNFGGS